MSVYFPSFNRQTRQRGTIALAALILLPVLVVALVFVVNSASLVKAKGQAQRCADSAALAAICAVVESDECRPGDHPSREHDHLLELARSHAQFCFNRNPTLGCTAKIRHCGWGKHPPGRHGQGWGDPKDLLICRFRRNDRGRWERDEQWDVDDNDRRSPNAVSVCVAHSHQRGNPIRLLGCGGPGRSSVDLICRATAVFDCNVIGFRPVFQCKPIPLVPIALPVCAGDHRDDDDPSPCRGWDCQFNRKNSDSRSLRFVIGLDREENALEGSGPEKGAPQGIAPQGIALAGSAFASGEDRDDDDDHDDDGRDRKNCRARLLVIADDASETIGRQISDGITRADLKRRFGGKLQFGPNGDCVIPKAAEDWLLENGSRVVQCLRQLQQSNQARVFPLYSDRHLRPDCASITSFVSARVVDVRTLDSGAIELSLRPARMSTATAITGKGIKGPGNRHGLVGKIRLVDSAAAQDASSQLGS